MRSPFFIALLALTSLTCPGPARADVGGSLSLEAGRTEHPLGIRDESATAYGVGTLRLEGATRVGSSTWRLGFDAQEVRFDTRDELDFSHLAAGLEWFREAPREGLGLSAGLQVAERTQGPVYAAYDHDEVFGYLAFKTYPSPSLLLRGHLGLRRRSYEALPEESFTEPFVQLEGKRFWENRTTLGLTARLGAKRFHEPEAQGVWGAGHAPTTSQFSLAAILARGLSDRIGIRAALRGAATLADFPYYVEADLYDSPLLDRYASSGVGATAAIKVLGPGQLWWELSGAIDGRDYGEIRFLDAGVGSERRDTVRSLGLSLTRTLRGGARFMAAVNRIEQNSSIENYDWSGTEFSAGLTWSR